MSRRRPRQLDTDGVKYPITVGRAIGWMRAKSLQWEKEKYSAPPLLVAIADVVWLRSDEWASWEAGDIRSTCPDRWRSQATKLRAALETMPTDQVLIAPPEPEVRDRRNSWSRSPRHRFPVTVRDAQRDTANESQSGFNYRAKDVVMAWLGHGEDASWALYAQALDRLAAEDPSQVICEIVGSKTLPMGRFAPKDTDEVREQGDSPSADSRYHGGDGNSQEVEGSQAQSTASQPNPADGDAGDGEMHPSLCDRTSPARPVSGNTAGDPDAGAKAGQAPGQSAAIAPLSKGQSSDSTALSEPGATDPGKLLCPATTQSPADAEGLDPRPDAGHVDRGDSPSDPRDDRQQGGSRDQLKPDAAPKAEKWARSFSGCTANLRESKPVPALIKRARQALVKILDAGDSQESPRRDYPEFCTRVKTYRNPSPARREEVGRPAILVVADTSPSVGAAIAHESLDAAMAIGALGVPGADVIVVNADNGRPYQVAVNGKITEAGGVFGCDTETGIKVWYRKLCSRWDIKVLVAIGDGDDRQMREVVLPQPGLIQGLYLSSYCSSFGGARRASLPPSFCEGLPRSAQKKLTYFDRCGSAIDLVTCLEN